MCLIFDPKDSAVKLKPFLSSLAFDLLTVDGFTVAFSQPGMVTIFVYVIVNLHNALHMASKFVLEEKKKSKQVPQNYLTT